MEGKVLPKAHFSFLPDLGRINRSSSLLKKDAPAKEIEQEGQSLFGAKKS